MNELIVRYLNSLHKIISLNFGTIDILKKLDLFPFDR